MECLHRACTSRIRRSLLVSVTATARCLLKPVHMQRNHVSKRLSWAGCPLSTLRHRHRRMKTSRFFPTWRQADDGKKTEKPTHQRVFLSPTPQRPCRLYRFLCAGPGRKQFSNSSGVCWNSVTELLIQFSGNLWDCGGPWFHCAWPDCVYVPWGVLDLHPCFFLFIKIGCCKCVWHEQPL